MHLGLPAANFAQMSEIRRPGRLARLSAKIKKDFQNDFSLLREFGRNCLLCSHQINRDVAFDRAIKHVCIYRWCLKKRFLKFDFIFNQNWGGSWEDMVPSIIFLSFRVRRGDLRREPYLFQK